MWTVPPIDAIGFPELLVGDEIKSPVDIHEVIKHQIIGTAIAVVVQSGVVMNKMGPVQWCCLRFHR